MATLAQLENQIRKLQQRADALRAKESVEVIAKIRAMMDEFGLTTADLAKAGLGTMKQRGRPAGSKKSAASKNGAVKSKLPPKYRDPVSGATWSGHARPPAWIKDAPDRSAYLIDAAKKAARRGRAASTTRTSTPKRPGRPAGKRTSRKSAQSTAA
ncbi:H-NS histone family protein [Caballeronia sp. EK]|uniref:H-NS histone family protein n=1 Tax=Caballeronia sp. EK TaxID=2767469 RepID=UPI00165628E5|nr:H-NS histone family protein [Caballeronia sp. EK]MBC8636716.1 H-NS histone family protein [Caballeronia sp. EK]